MTRALTHLAMCLPVLACAACLDQGAAERAGYSAHVLPPGAQVPRAEDDTLLAGKIKASIAADGEIPLRLGYAHGQLVQYWDLGTLMSASAKPVFILERRGRDEDEALTPIDHAPLVDSLPGDSAYSPFRAIFSAAVTDAYAGERIASLAALEDAIELGLVEEPKPTGTYVLWPIVPEETALSRQGESLHTETLYCKGLRASYLPIDALEDAKPFERSVSAPSAYLLRRENETAVLEEGEDRDLNGDGDTFDSNAIFTLDLRDEPDAGYSGLWTQVNVVVPPSYAFGVSRDELDLFEQTDAGLQAIDGALIEFASTTTLLLRPLDEAPQ